MRLHFWLIEYTRRLGEADGTAPETSGLRGVWSCPEDAHDPG